MKQFIEIIDVTGREILDSRGNPTVGWRSPSTTGRITNVGARRYPPALPPASSSVEPASCATDKSRYLGKGYGKAVENANTEIAETCAGLNELDQVEIDQTLHRALTGTPNKSRLWRKRHPGRPLCLRRPAKARPEALGLSLFSYVGRRNTPKRCPWPMMNILNRRRARTKQRRYSGIHDHAGRRVSFTEGLRWCAEVFQTSKRY